MLLRAKRLHQASYVGDLEDMKLVHAVMSAASAKGEATNMLREKLGDLSFEAKPAVEDMEHSPDEEDDN